MLSKLSFLAAVIVFGILIFGHPTGAAWPYWGFGLVALGLLLEGVGPTVP